VRSYRAVNAVDDATINLPDFIRLVAGSASPEGMVPGSLLGTWNDGFGIERPALPICVSSIVIGSCHNLQRVYLKISKINKRKLRFVEKVTWLRRLRCPCSFAITTFGSSCIGLSEVVVVSPTAGSV
jgi:hypothetical protein